jgi:hypothetical protein
LPYRHDASIFHKFIVDTFRALPLADRLTYLRGGRE